MRGARPRRTAVILCLLATGACTGSAGSQPESAPRPDPAPRSQPSAAEAAEIEALYRARTDSARMRFTEADVGFATGMITHHAQALIMAELAPTHGARRSIQTLAARIINAQKDEIATMQRWLRDREQPVPEVVIDGLRLEIRGAGHAHHMPGMLTDEQLRELDAARGTEFDRLFLTYMIQHHRGAVTIVHDLFATDGAAQDEAIFRLASDIQVDQLTEIARMESMLASMSNNPNEGTR